MLHSKWTSRQIKDQSDKIAIVTGGASGLGFETALALASKNATVILAVRNMEKGNAAIEQIKTQLPGAAIFTMHLDLADLSSIHTFAKAFKDQYQRLDLLINNAGVMIPPFEKTKDGFELQMGTNHLGHFALTGQLISLIKSTLDSRIVNVSSMAHKIGNINLEDLNWANRIYSKWQAYGDSKIANLYFTFALAKKLETIAPKVIVAASHPGWSATQLQRHTGLFINLNSLFAQSAKMGALPTLCAACEDHVKSGDFYGPDGFFEARGYPKKVMSNYRSKDDAIAQKLWTISEELTGITFD